MDVQARDGDQPSQVLPVEVASTGEQTQHLCRTTKRHTAQKPTHKGRGIFLFGPTAHGHVFTVWVCTLLSFLDVCCCAASLCLLHFISPTFFSLFNFYFVFSISIGISSIAYLYITLENKFLLDLLNGPGCIHSIPKATKTTNTCVHAERMNQGIMQDEKVR